MVLLHSEQKLNIGNSAPDFTLKDINGNHVSLSNFDKPILIIFMCNHCPYVQSKFQRIIDIQNKYKDEIVVIGINSNSNPDCPEDSFDNMKKYSKEYDFNFLYLFDKTQEVSKKYGAVCTPDPFLFDSEKKLYYHGRFDDALSPEQTPKEFDMEDAIDKMLKGEEPSKELKPSMGCSIKWQK